MSRFAQSIRIQAPWIAVWAVLVDVEVWPSSLLHRTIFSRNTRSATEGLKRYVEGSVGAEW